MRISSEVLKAMQSREMASFKNMHRFEQAADEFLAFYEGEPVSVAEAKAIARICAALDKLLEKAAA